MTQHSPSPLPWQHSGNGLIYGQCTDWTDEAPWVADVIADRERAAFGLLTDQERANAELIVRARNSHAPLVAALELMAGAAGQLAAAIDGTTDQFDHELRCLNQTRSTALAALRLARGAS